jgi:hypothetical protein
MRHTARDRAFASGLPFFTPFNLDDQVLSFNLENWSMPQEIGTPKMVSTLEHAAQQLKAVRTWSGLNCFKKRSNGVHSGNLPATRTSIETRGAPPKYVP